MTKDKKVSETAREEAQFEKTRRIQRRAARLQEDEVYCRQTATVEFFIKHDENFLDDVENFYADMCPSCGESVDGATEVPDDVDAAHYCQSCESGFEETNSEQKEISGWWAVSTMLAEKLAEVGEVICSGPDCKLWGRTHSGQNMLLDGTFQRISENLEPPE